MKEVNIQWHPGFVSAMDLEFMEDRESLKFEKEYNLNTKPLEIDLLVIKKEAGIQIANEIGSFFRGHNILEYKSPYDHLDIDVFYKAQAYAGLYKSYGRKVDERKAEDITVSLLREEKPKGLFRCLKEYGFHFCSAYKGIYYVEGNILFPTQVIVTKELDEEAHIWLRALSRNVRNKDARLLLQKIRGLKEKRDRELADSVLEVMMEANKSLIEEWKGDEKMFEVLMELMEPQLQQREEAGRREGLQTGRLEGLQTGRLEGLQTGRLEGLQTGRLEGLQTAISGVIEVLRSFGHKDMEIKAIIMEKYGLTETEIEKYF